MYWTNYDLASDTKQEQGSKQETLHASLRKTKYHKALQPQLNTVPSPPNHQGGCSSPTQIHEYVNTRHTIHPPIHSWWPSIPCGYWTCLRFLVTQCSVYVVAGILPSASKDSTVRCVISSLTLNAILELSFCTLPLQQFLWQHHLNHF